ncbi:MAG: F-type H+-transporting ATPase subunit delta [Chloroflexota bacterium]|jgi:F-type H+-transporting ATPase subunit delta|nr:F-type H+-transporting ATPase subunit delta [Chloroflexota bacterium]
MPARPGSARRYAEALFSIAKERGTLDAWQTELERAGAVLRQPGAERALETPGVPIAAKRAALESVTGPLSREVGVLIDMLFERKRLGLLPQIADAFAARVREERGIELADVTSAVPLTTEEQQIVAQRLSQRLGRTVTVTTHVDPSIMGGVVARVGDQLIDASVRGKLEALRRQLHATV